MIRKTNNKIAKRSATWGFPIFRMDKPSFFRGCNQEFDYKYKKSQDDPRFVPRWTESNPWNDNWNRRWKFTNVVHFTPFKILRRHHCHPYGHHHQQQHHFHFSSSSWSLALEPYLSRWAPLDFFLPVIDIEGALVSMSTVREKVSCTFSYRILRGLCTKWTGPSKHCDIRPGQWGRSCLLRFMGPRRKRNQLIVLKFIQNVSGFKICLPSSI